MQESDSNSIALITHVTGERETRELADTPDSQLLTRLTEGERQILHLATMAVSAAEQGLQVAFAQGQILEILFKRHEGEFAQWLSLQSKSDGSPLMSESTALRWRTLWRERDQIFPPDGSEPTCRARTKAYIKLELLPEPEQAERDPFAVQSVLRLSYHLPAGDPDAWPAADRREFLTKAEPIALNYLKALPRDQAVALLETLIAAA